MYAVFRRFRRSAVLDHGKIPRCYLSGSRNDGGWSDKRIQPGPDDAIQSEAGGTEGF
ncbi:hypothetical protein D3C81_1984960 [compost metagenome]